MRTPTPEQLLQVWERGGSASAAARGLLLLGCCDDAERSATELVALPLGRRDALLLDLRERLFGDAIDVVAPCPQCASTVEATFRCSDLRMTAPGDDAPALTHGVSVQGMLVRFRLPDSSDLIALEDCGDAGTAHTLLLERCVLAAEGDDAQGLTTELQAEIAEAMAQIDPQADLQLAFRCPDCDHAWQPLFDIARFLWQELHAWALRQLREVDTLAQAYHWSESDILALSQRRRQAYLELCAS